MNFVDEKIKYIANIPTENPRNSLPELPKKIFAGLKLKTKNTSIDRIKQRKYKFIVCPVDR